MAGPTEGIPLALTYGSFPYAGYGPVVVGGYVGVGAFRSGHHGDGRGQGGGRGHAVGAGQAPRCERPPARATTPARPAPPPEPRSAPTTARAPALGISSGKGRP
jgi:hypothetical protein